MKFLPRLPPPPLVLRGAFVAAVLALLAAGMIGFVGQASADQSSPSRDADNNLIFHCGENQTHPLNVSLSCPSNRTRNLDRSLLCGLCYTDGQLRGITRYGQEIPGKFIFNGKTYHNGDADDGNLRRTNTQFCDAWLGGAYDETTKTCSCPRGEIPQGNHGRCTLLAMTCTGNSNPHPASSSCPDTGTGAVISDPASQSCGTCYSERDLEAQGCDGTTSFIYTYEGSRYCGPLSQCEAVNGVRDGRRASCSPPASSADCADGRVFKNGECEVCDANQHIENGACVCDAGYTDIDSDVGVDCRQNTGAEVCVTSNEVPGGDPHVLEIAPCRTDASVQEAISTDPAAPFSACGSCIVGTLGSCGSPNILYTYNGHNFCGPESQCIAAGGSDEDGLCCPEGQDAFGGTACRAPTSSMECRTLNPQAPIFESGTGTCRAAANDADCADVFSPNVPFRNTDGSCRLPGNNTECASLNSGAKPLYDADAPDNCAAGTDANCARLHPSAPNFFNGACLDNLCSEGSNSGENPHDDPINGEDCAADDPDDFYIPTAGAECGSCLDGGHGSCSERGAGYILYENADHNFCGPQFQCEEIGGIRPGNLNCAEDDCAAGFVDTDPGAGLTCDPIVEISACAPNQHVVNNECAPCPVNTARAAEETSCMACENGQMRPADATECACPSGTFDSGRSCDPVVELSACAVNQHVENNRCVPCPVNTARATEETSCMACENGQMRPADATECACPSGTFDSGSSCDPIVELSACAVNQHVENNQCAPCPVNTARATEETSCMACAYGQMRPANATECACPSGTFDSGRSCDPAVELSSCDVNQHVENNQCAPCPADTARAAEETSCMACTNGRVRPANQEECACPAFTEADGSCAPFMQCEQGESLNRDDNTCSSECDTVVQQNNVCEPDIVCNGPNQVRIAATNTCDCSPNYEDLDSTDPLNCIRECVSPEVRQRDNSCAENAACDALNQIRDETDNTCACEEGYADSDTSTTELTCTMTPNCDMSANQRLDRTRNVCDCMDGFTDRDAAPETLDCEMIPICDMTSEVLNPATNECVPLSSCAPPRRFQQNGDCEENVDCTEQPNQRRDEATNECVCESNFARQTDNSCAEGCPNTQKILNGVCLPLTSSDCLPAEKFENEQCVLLDPGEWSGSAPPYGEYEHTDCTRADWPWSIVQTTDGLSELCHAPVRVLSIGPLPSGQQLREVHDEADFCVLRGHSGEGYLRCDDASVFGSLGMPRPGNASHLVTPITSAITLTLADGAVRAAMSVRVRVDDYLDAVHVSGSVIAVFDHGTAEAAITVTEPLVGSISLETPAPTMSVTSPPATNTMTPPATTPPPAAGGGDSGGGGGAAAALIAVPVVLIGGYWLLGGFDYIDPTYNLTYQGENDNLTYRGNAGFDLHHGNLSSYARAIQSDGEAVSYQSGISYGNDIYSLNYAATEDASEYAYDLGARLNYGSGLWTISPSADAAFHYSADREDWTTDASAGISAVWTAHRWILRAQSDFAGDSRHRLEIQREL